MNAPLSRYLVSFSLDPLPAIVPPDPVMVEPLVTLAASELVTRLEAARLEGHAAADLEHRRTIEALAATHDTALEKARADWSAAEAAGVAALLESAFAALRETLAEQIARVLRPLLAEAVAERAKAALEEALRRLLDDPGHPCVTLRGPADLIEAIRSRVPCEGLRLVAADGIEAFVSADGTHIETRLGAALAALAGTEA